MSSTVHSHDAKDFSELASQAKTPHLSPMTRIDACFSLWSQTKKVVGDVLISISQQPDVHWFLRTEAAIKLGRMGETTEAMDLLRLIGDEIPQAKVDVAEALADMGAHDEAASILLEQGRSSQHRAPTVVATLEKFNRVTELLELLHDPSVIPENRCRAAEGLIRLGFVDKIASVLLELNKDPQLKSSTRLHVSSLLLKTDQSKMAVEILKILAEHADDETVKNSAARLLCGSGA